MRKINWLFCLITIATFSANVYSEKIIFNSNSHIGYISIDISGNGCTGKIYWQTNDNNEEKNHEKSVDLVNCFVEPSQKEVRVKVGNVGNADATGNHQLLDWHPKQSGSKTSFVSQYE